MRRRRACPWSLTHPLVHRNCANRMSSVAAATANPPSALGRLTAYAPSQLQLLPWPETVARRGESERSNTSNTPLFWLTLPPPLSSAIPRHVSVLHSTSVILDTVMEPLLLQARFTDDNNCYYQMKPINALGFTRSFSSAHLEESSALQKQISYLQSYAPLKPTSAIPVSRKEGK
ncbi:hypothetical protein MUK42_09239 [Musa troglodytarum]|uniref:Uncharacterized protein n=1 Tax=Musa troglodytarum TaxID=320322 RepID=A0A9E7EAK1_9LILI|nr:hypothetical protein MUK42_09239 [Musa troglodytarum]